MPRSNNPRPIVLVVAALAVVSPGVPLPRAHAQRVAVTGIEWTTFVGGEGVESRTVVIDDAPGRIDLGPSAWTYGYARTRAARVRGDDRAAQRVLACRRGAGTVSSTATCRVHDGAVDERAVTLSLGTVGDPGYLTVTLGCRAQAHRQ